MLPKYDDKDVKEKIKKREAYVYDDHKYVSRRDFLRAGLIDTMSVLSLPTLGALLAMPDEAFAQMQCDPLSPNVSPNLPPVYIFLCLSGGAAMRAFAGIRSGNPTSGPMAPWANNGTSQSPSGSNLDNSYGRVPIRLANGSSRNGFEEGLRTLNTTQRNKVGIAAACTIRQDDSLDLGSPHYILELLHSLPFFPAPALLPGGITTSEFNGGTHYAGYRVQNPNPNRLLTIARGSEALQKIQGPMALKALDLSGRTALKNKIAGFSSSDAAKVLQMSGGPALMQLLSGALPSMKFCDEQAAELVVGSANPDCKAAWDEAFEQTNYLTSNPPYGAGGIASNVLAMLNNYASHGTIALGGYDYHDSTRSGDERDEYAGRTVAAIIKLAERLQRRVFIHIESDGSATGGSVWTNDGAANSLDLFMVYNPFLNASSRTAANQALYQSNTAQMGVYTSSGSGIETNTALNPIARDHFMATKAIVMNYAFASGLTFSQIPSQITDGIGPWANIFKSTMG